MKKMRECVKEKLFYILNGYILAYGVFIWQFIFFNDYYREEVILNNSYYLKQFYYIEITKDIKILTIVYLIFLMGLFYVLNFSKKIKKKIQNGIVILCVIVTFTFIFQDIKGVLMMFSSSFVLLKHRWLIHCLMGVSFLGLYLIREGCFWGNGKDDSMKEPLFEERKEDLKKIKVSLDKSNVVGIDGEWGEGKTFLLEKLLEDIKNVEIIKINILNLKEEEVFGVVLKEIDKILRRNLIYFGQSKKINTIIKNQSLFGINLNGFFSNITMSEALFEYKEAIKKLNKKIILVFDDVDRVEDKEKIRKILHIGSEMSMEELKVIYLYNQEKLTEIGLGREYIEKFIPLHNPLTKIGFEKFLKRESFENDDIDIKKFYFLFKTLDKSNMEFLLSSKLIESNISIQLNFDKNIRKIKYFLEEVKSLMKIKEENRLDIEDRLIIAFSFIKVMMNEEYVKLKNMESIPKAFPIKVKYKEHELTLEELDLIITIIDHDEKITLIDSDTVKIHTKKYSIERINELLGKINKMLSCIVEGEEIRILGLKDLKINYNNFYQLIKPKRLRKIDEESFIRNLLVRSMLDYDSTHYNSSEEKIEDSEEKNETILENLKKLLYIGNEEYLSSYKTFYKQMEKVMEEDNVENRKEAYNKLLLNYNSENPTKLIFKLEEKTIIKILNIFGGQDKLYIFLEIILNKYQGLNNDLLKIIGEEEFRRKDCFLRIVEGVISKDRKEKINRKLIIKLINGIIRGVQHYYGFIGLISYLNEEESIEKAKDKLNDLKEKFLELHSPVMTSEIKITTFKKELISIVKCIDLLLNLLENATESSNNQKEKKESDKKENLMVQKLIEELREKEVNEISKILDEKYKTKKLKSYQLRQIVKELGI